MTVTRSADTSSRFNSPENRRRLSRATLTALLFLSLLPLGESSRAEAQDDCPRPAYDLPGVAESDAQHFFDAQCELLEVMDEAASPAEVRNAQMQYLQAQAIVEDTTTFPNQHREVHLPDLAEIQMLQQRKEAVWKALENVDLLSVEPIAVIPGQVSDYRVRYADRANPANTAEISQHGMVVRVDMNDGEYQATLVCDPEDLLTPESTANFAEPHFENCRLTAIQEVTTRDGEHPHIAAYDAELGLALGPAEESLFPLLPQKDLSPR